MDCEWVVSGETKSGTIGPNENYCYWFSGQVGQGVVIEVARLSGDLYPRIQLYDPIGVPVCDETSYPLARIDNYVLKMNGIYTIVISSLTPGTGQYKLFLSLTSAKDPHGLYPYAPQPPDGGSVSLCDWHTLRWWSLDVARVTGYDVYLAPGPLMPLKKVAENIAGPPVPRPVLENKHGVCYWRVVAHTPQGDIQGPIW